MSQNVQWFYARYEDSETWSGGEATRDDAIAAGRSDFDPEDGFYVCRAGNPPLRIADWIGADTMLERAREDLVDSDRACSECDQDGDFFSCTADQEADLIRRIRLACEEWQETHSLVFTVRTFEWMDVAEYIAPATERVE